MSVPNLSWSARRVWWESDVAAIGKKIDLHAIVRLKATRSRNAPQSPIVKELEVEFRVSEYSGKPPSKGGGSVSDEIEVLRKRVVLEVMPGASVETEVTTQWLVKCSGEKAPFGDLPEFRCQACISGAGPFSKLLKLGQVTDACWQQPSPAATPANNKAAEFWFQDDQRVGLRLEANGIQGFTADFKIYDDPDDQLASANREVRTITGIPITAGVAETQWRLSEAELPSYSFGNFKFDTLLRHKDMAMPIALPRIRSRNIRHTATVQVFFVLYYVFFDNAFKKAAQTVEKVLSEKRKDKRFRIVFKSFKSESDFTRSWDFIASFMKQFPNTSRIIEGHVFSHASYGDSVDGLEFDPGTLNQLEIQVLPKLPWAADGRLILHGCNTGVDAVRGWCPAGVFAKAQGVKTVGQRGYATFSGRDEQHELIPVMGIHGGDVYLWSYDRTHNNRNGDGHKLPGREFVP